MKYVLIFVCVFVSVGCARDGFRPPPLKPFQEADFKHPATTPTKVVTVDCYVMNPWSVSIWIRHQNKMGGKPSTTHVGPGMTVKFTVPKQTMETFDAGHMVVRTPPPETYLEAFRLDTEGNEHKVELDRGDVVTAKSD
jgi:hypothetical protein